MILAQHKETGRVYEHVGCDPFGTQCTLRNNDGTTITDDERKYNLSFKNDPFYNALLKTYKEQQ